VRNSDGTELPGIVSELATKVYSTYFVGRGDNAWADAHPDEATRIFLMSDRVAATADGPVSIDLLASWFADQVRPDTGCDVTRWWQAHDRTTGQELPASAWSIGADGRTVTVHEALAGHVYTIIFLAVQTWDPTQMYNYLTNGWDEDPTRVKDKPFDVRHEATWSHVRAHLSTWLTEHPEVDVVRFTTFFYHFTLVYGADATERFVDWFGYSAPGRGPPPAAGASGCPAVPAPASLPWSLPQQWHSVPPLPEHGHWSTRSTTSWPRAPPTPRWLHPPRWRRRPPGPRRSPPPPS